MEMSDDLKSTLRFALLREIDRLAGKIEKLTEKRAVLVRAAEQVDRAWTRPPTDFEAVAATIAEAYDRPSFVSGELFPQGIDTSGTRFWVKEDPHIHAPVLVDGSGQARGIPSPEGPAFYERGMGAQKSPPILEEVRPEPTADPPGEGVEANADEG